jgi:cytochrome c
MDAFEKNKIAGAILSALLLTVSIDVLSNTLFDKGKAQGIGYDLPSDEGAPSSSEKQAAAAEPSVPFPVLLAKADPARGEKAVGKCKACHSFEKGGPNRVGPNLYGIITHTMGAAAGFNYSSAFKEKNAQKAVWTFEAMDSYLTNPKAYIKGTNMAFAGISKAEERADLIAYLRTLSDSPAPLPATPLPATPPPEASAPASPATAPPTAPPSPKTPPTPSAAPLPGASAPANPATAPPAPKTPPTPSAAPPPEASAPPTPATAPPAPKTPPTPSNAH